jgi:hypothetical protein
MNYIILRNLFAIGMHHWGRKDLQIGPVYYSFPQSNPHDRNAIAIFENKQLLHKVAYLRREDKMW